jgi:hypothetical protein
MKELIRKTVLEYLALRPTGAFEVPQITRMINMRGMLDEHLSEESTQEALTFLVGLEHASMVHGEYGSSRHYQVTSKGVLAHERGLL